MNTLPAETMLPAADGWALMKAQAGELLKSGFLPSGFKNVEQVVAVILKGRELGIPPMQALSHIHVINGKPTMSAELMLAQIFKLHPLTKISYPVRSGKACQIKVQRHGCEPSVFEFTIEDATTAGLMSNPTWKKYPRAMLHARCVSEMARSLFPDAISGISYTPEELGAEVNEDGEVIDVAPVAAEPVMHRQKERSTKTLEERVTYMLEQFAKLGVSRHDLEEEVGRPCDMFEDIDFTRAKELHGRLVRERELQSHAAKSQFT